jgi:hypothetical protein
VFVANGCVFAEDIGILVGIFAFLPSALRFCLLLDCTGDCRGHPHASCSPDGHGAVIQRSSQGVNSVSFAMAQVDSTELIFEPLIERMLFLHGEEISLVFSHLSVSLG